MRVLKCELCNKEYSAMPHSPHPGQYDMWNGALGIIGDLCADCDDKIKPWFNVMIEQMKKMAKGE